MISRIFGIIIGNWQIAVGIVALLIASHTLAYCSGRSEGRKLERAEQVQAERKARDLQDKSAGIAAGEQADNDKTISDAQKERDDAIRNSGEADRKPSAGRTVLFCDRLRRNGQPTDHIPACATSQGGSGASTER